MEVIVGDERIEIDVAKIVCDIDSVMHDELTDKTGVTVDHDDIIKFVSGIIRENNVRELRLWRAIEQDIERSEKIKKENDDKIKRGKVVRGVNTFMEKFKYHMFGYVDVGIGMSDDEAVMFVRDKRDNGN